MMRRIIVCKTKLKLPNNQLRSPLHVVPSPEAAFQSSWFLLSQVDRSVPLESPTGIIRFQNIHLYNPELHRQCCATSMRQGLRFRNDPHLAFATAYPHRWVTVHTNKTQVIQCRLSNSIPLTFSYFHCFLSSHSAV